MASHKTPLMRRVEREKGESLEALLPRLINEQGVGGAAGLLMVSRGTVRQWMLLLGMRRVVASPDRGTTDHA